MNMAVSPKTLTTPVKSERYSTVAIVLHWLIAAAIAAQIFLGWRMEDLNGLGRSLLLQVHKSVGISILVLTAARLAWRLYKSPPPHHHLTPVEHHLSHWVHVGFYTALMALPLTGWAMVSLEKSGGMTVFGGLMWPAFPLLTALPGGVQDTLAEVFNNTHSILVWIMLGLLGLHVAGALKHHFISRDPTLSRMAPGVKPGAIVDARLLSIPLVVAGVAALVYLPKPPEAKARPAPASLAVADIYLDVTQPALDRRCSSCHSDDQSRGGLSVTSYDALMHGGRGGAVIKPGDAKDSDLFRRITLSPTHKEYMPKGEKPPLSADQIAAIEVWINAGAPRSGQIGSLKLSDAQKAILQKALPKRDDGDDSGLPVNSAMQALPTVAVADGLAVTSLESSGFIVRRIDKTTNLVDVDFSGLKPMTDADLAALARIGPQILSLNLRKAGVTDAQLKTIAQWKNLRELRLQDNAITDAGLAQLSGLTQLEELNLVSTKVSDAALTTIAGFKALKTVFLWNTEVTQPGFDRLRAEHKDLTVMGGVKPADVVKDTVLRQPQN